MSEMRMAGEEKGRIRGLRPAALATLAALIAVPFLTGPSPASAGTNIEGARSPDGRFITGFTAMRWDARALPVGWRIQRDGVINNTNNGGTEPLSVAQVVSLIDQAFAQWNAVPGSTARALFDSECRLTGLHPGVVCAEGRTSTATVGVDGENIFTWSDPGTLGSGTLARTVLTSLEQDVVVDAAARDIDGDGQIDLSPLIYPDGITLPAGTIVDADITYNSAASDWVSTPSTVGTLVDVVGVSLHEQGHWLGLAHSPIWGPIPTMFPFADTNSIEAQLNARTLESDDRASLRRFYPAATYADGFGEVRGRLVDAAGQPLGGEPVIAIDASTLQTVAFDFTAHALTEYEAGAGSFTIAGLPPGEYFLQVGALDSSYIFLERNRFNYTVYYSEYLEHRPSLAVAAGQETAADDLLPPRRVRVPTLRTGGPVDAGALVANSGPANLAPLGSAAPLRLGDNEAVLIDFPAGFTFPFYGISYRKMFVYDNGFVTFTNATSPVPDPMIIPTAGTRFVDEGLVRFLTGSPRVGVLFRNHDPSVDDRGPSTGTIDVYYSVQPDRVSLTWAAVPEVILNLSLQDNPARADTFTLTLHASGLVEMSYGSLGTPSGTVGVTPGGTSVSFRRVDLSHAALFQAGPLEAIVEEWFLSRPDYQLGRFRFESGVDLNGGRLLFIPGPNTSYEVRQPGLRPGEVSGPGSAVPLSAGGSTPTLLTWDAAAPLFNLYRSLLSTLRGIGAYTPSGSCLASGLSAASYADSATPPAGDGFHYLVSGENAAGVEGTLGMNSAGAERANANPCP